MTHVRVWKSEKYHRLRREKLRINISVTNRQNNNDPSLHKHMVVYAQGTLHYRLVNSFMSIVFVNCSLQKR